MPRQMSVLIPGRKSPRAPGPLLDVVPLPCRAPAHPPAGLGEAQTSRTPLVHGVPGHTEPLSDLDDSHRLNRHIDNCTQTVDSRTGCEQNAYTTRSGPGAASTARGPATTEVPVMTRSDLTRPLWGGASPPDEGSEACATFVAGTAGVS
jgi:hypothetical protein